METLVVILALVGLALSVTVLIIKYSDRQSPIDAFYGDVADKINEAAESIRYIDVTNKDSTEREFYDRIDKCVKTETEIKAKK